MVNLYDILVRIDPRLPWPGMLVLISMAAAAAALHFAPVRPAAPWVRPATRACATALCVLAVLPLGLAISYFFYPRYLDWIEATIVTTSWIGWRGGYFYSLLDGGDMTGVWYGPVLFHLNGVMLGLFGPSIASSKLLGVIAFFTAQFVTFKVLTRAGASRAQALTLTAIQCLLQAGFMNQGSAFGVRTDPLLLLASACGAWVALRTPNFVNAAILGALIGLCGNLKVQGAFFIFPIFMFFISRGETHLRQAQLFGVATLAGVVGLLIPFVPESAAPERYLGLLGMTKHFAISKWVLEINLVFLAMLWSPAIWLYAAFRPKLPTGLLWFGAACVPAMGLVTVAASIYGGGPYNYLAFVPPMAWMLVQLLRTIRAQSRDAANIAKLDRACLGALAAFLIGFTPMLAIASHRVMKQYGDAPLLRQAQAQIDREMAAHPRALVAVGPGRYADLRVIPVFRGHPLAIDSEAWMDLMLGGVGDERVRKLIRNCRMDTWMLPAGDRVFFEPNAPEIYSPEFVAEFRAHYRRDPSGGVLDAWRCVRRDSAP